MKWELIEQNDKAKRSWRKYRNQDTGSESVTELLLIDKEGIKWWGFKDLYAIPYIRMAMAKHITDLYTIGLSPKDITEWCNKIKSLSKSNDPEKYEKIYSNVLEMENIATQTADIYKQHLALCTVYVMRDEERIDYFTEQMAGEKMIYWNADIDLVTFFLTWHNRHIANYTKNLNKISEIVSKTEKKANNNQIQP